MLIDGDDQLCDSMVLNQATYDVLDLVVRGRLLRYGQFDVVNVGDGSAATCRAKRQQSFD